MKLVVGIYAMKLELEPPGWDWSLEEGVEAMKLGLEPRGWD